MNTRFKEAEAHKITAPGIAVDCPECRAIYGYQGRPEIDFYNVIDSQEVIDEGSFSWMPCDACGDALGGSRFIVHEFTPGSDELTHLEVCIDCYIKSA